MKPVSRAATYAMLLPELIAAGRDVGYAVAPHGSMARDLDLVAVPWTEEAGTAEELILRLLAASAGHLCDGARKVEGKDELETVRGDVGKPKPHGRRAWTIFLGNGLYLDVSVMPRAPRAAGSAPCA